MIISPFPDSVGFSVIEQHNNPLEGLFPEELTVLSPAAVEKRRIQFARGRIAAHAALRSIGLEPSPIGKGERGEPIWPNNIIGSISHSSEYAIAAVCSDSFQAIGVDIEDVNTELSHDISERICLTGELAWVNSADCKDAHLRRVLSIFSAKETIYKALYPLCHKIFGFEDAHLTWVEEKKHFEAKLLTGLSDSLPPGFKLTVGCSLSDKYVFTHTLI